eukprot:scaffold10157_cov162-Amphora_coffeaeformis.AAC.6
MVFFANAVSRKKRFLHHTGGGRLTIYQNSVETKGDDATWENFVQHCDSSLAVDRAFLDCFREDWKPHEGHLKHDDGERDVKTGKRDMIADEERRAKRRKLRGGVERVVKHTHASESATEQGNNNAMLYSNNRYASGTHNYNFGARNTAAEARITSLETALLQHGIAIPRPGDFVAFQGQSQAEAQHPVVNAAAGIPGRSNDS